MHAGWGLLQHLPLPRLLFVQTECPRAGAAHPLSKTNGHVSIPPWRSPGRAGVLLTLSTQVWLDARLRGRPACLSQQAMFVYNGDGNDACCLLPIRTVGPWEQTLTHVCQL